MEQQWMICILFFIGMACALPVSDDLDLRRALQSLQTEQRAEEEKRGLEERERLEDTELRLLMREMLDELQSRREEQTNELEEDKEDDPQGRYWVEDSWIDDSKFKKNNVETPQEEREEKKEDDNEIRELLERLLEQKEKEKKDVLADLLAKWALISSAIIVCNDPEKKFSQEAKDAAIKALPHTEPGTDTHNDLVECRDRQEDVNNPEDIVDESRIKKQEKANENENEGAIERELNNILDQIEKKKEEAKLKRILEILEQLQHTQA